VSTAEATSSGSRARGYIIQWCCSLSTCRRRRLHRHACMHVYEHNSRTHIASGRIQCAHVYHRSSREKTAASSVKKRSHYGNPWNFQFNPICGWHQHGEATSACQWITSLWSGGHDSMPARQLNPQHPAPQQQFNSHINNTGRRAWNTSVRIGWRRAWKSLNRFDQSIHKRAQFSNMLQELKQLQQQQQVPSVSKHLPKCLSSRLQLN